MGLLAGINTSFIMHKYRLERKVSRREGLQGALGTFVWVFAGGCAHSAAMRGLALYLLQNHRGEFTNEQILEQMTMWKTMFFPKQMYQKAIQLQARGQSVNGQVLDEIPDMVGGC